MESLIHYETLNLWKVPKDPSTDDGKGFLRSLGADYGVTLLLLSNTFEYMRFCKGLFVHRSGQRDYMQNYPGLLDY